MYVQRMVLPAVTLLKMGTNTQLPKRLISYLRGLCSVGFSIRVGSQLAPLLTQPGTSSPEPRSWASRWALPCSNVFGPALVLSWYLCWAWRAGPSSLTVLQTFCSNAAYHDRDPGPGHGRDHDGHGHDPLPRERVPSPSCVLSRDHDPSSSLARGRSGVRDRDHLSDASWPLPNDTHDPPRGPAPCGSDVLAVEPPPPTLRQWRRGGGGDRSSSFARHLEHSDEVAPDHRLSSCGGGAREKEVSSRLPAGVVTRSGHFGYFLYLCQLAVLVWALSCQKGGDFVEVYHLVAATCVSSHPLRHWHRSLPADHVSVDHCLLVGCHVSHGVTVEGDGRNHHHIRSRESFALRNALGDFDLETTCLGSIH